MCVFVVCAQRNFHPEQPCFSDQREFANWRAEIPQRDNMCTSLSQSKRFQISSFPRAVTVMSKKPISSAEETDARGPAVAALYSRAEAFSLACLARRERRDVI